MANINRDIFNLTENYYGYDFEKNDIIQKEDGTFMINFETSDGHRIVSFKSLDPYTETISMIIRLRDFGFENIHPTFEIINKKTTISCNKDTKTLTVLYSKLLSNIAQLREKYGDDYTKHKAEITPKSILSQDSILSPKTSYDVLRENYNRYINTLPESERKELETAIRIYNSSLFIAINTMTSVDGYENLSGEQLLEECNKSKDFRENIPAIYKRMVTALASDPIPKEEEYLKLFESILDFSSEESFMLSLKSVTSILEQHHSNIRAPKDLYVYRGVATNQTPDLKKLSRGKIVSTSTNPNVAADFTYRNTNYKYMECILIKKGTPYLIPQSEQGIRQQEIMLLQDSLEITRIPGNTERTNYLPTLTYTVSDKEKSLENELTSQENKDNKDNKIQEEL